MSILQSESLRIVTYPHSTLRHKSKAVKRVDADLKDTISRMFELMYEANGVGLAANQVDLPLRLFVVNLEADPEKGEEHIFINPVLTKPKGTAESDEGCLSLPELYGPVRRPERINVNAYDQEGREFAAELTGLFARVVQHETDHLDGVLFIDRMSETNRLQIEPEIAQFRQEFDRQLASADSLDDQPQDDRLAEIERKYC